MVSLVQQNTGAFAGVQAVASRMRALVSATRAIVVPPSGDADEDNADVDDMSQEEAEDAGRRRRHRTRRRKRAVKGAVDVDDMSQEEAERDVVQAEPWTEVDSQEDARVISISRPPGLASPELQPLTPPCDLNHSDSFAVEVSADAARAMENTAQYTLPEEDWADVGPNPTIDQHHSAASTVGGAGYVPFEEDWEDFGEEHRRGERQRASAAIASLSVPVLFDSYSSRPAPLTVAESADEYTAWPEPSDKENEDLGDECIRCAFVTCSWRGPPEDYVAHISLCQHGSAAGWDDPASACATRLDSRGGADEWQPARRDGPGPQDKWQRVGTAAAKQPRTGPLGRPGVTQRVWRGKPAPAVQEHRRACESGREVPRRRILGARRIYEPKQPATNLAPDEITMKVPCGPNAYRIVRVKPTSQEEAPEEEERTPAITFAPAEPRSAEDQRQSAPAQSHLQLGVSEDDALKLALEASRVATDDALEMALEASRVAAEAEEQRRLSELAALGRYGVSNQRDLVAEMRSGVVGASAAADPTAKPAAAPAQQPTAVRHQTPQQPEHQASGTAVNSDADRNAEWKLRRRRDPRSQLIKGVFRMCDADQDGYLSRAELKRFAAHTGFDGDDTEWTEEYGALCDERKSDPALGLDSKSFADLVNDQGEGGCPCTDEELRKILAACVQ